ncbi:unnamed protein product, partial [Staurois parvus]
MDTDRWHCWGYTDHQGTLIISALMITDYRLSSPLSEGHSASPRMRGQSEDVIITASDVF